MRPGGPMPNFFMPLVQQGQQNPRPGGRRAGAGPVQQTQQTVPLLQQQVNNLSCFVPLSYHPSSINEVGINGDLHLKP